MEDRMSYRVNASSSAGAVSIPVCFLDDAWAKAETLASKGHRNIVIIDAGTGMPVRYNPALFDKASDRPTWQTRFPGEVVALRTPE